IPINRAKAVMREIKEFGRLRPMQIDFGIMTLNTPRVQGVIITSMDADGGGAQAGWEVGDVVTAVDGRRTTTRQDCILMVASKQGGDVLKLDIWRNGEARTLDYQLVEAQIEPPAPR